MPFGSATAASRLAHGHQRQRYP